MPGHGQGLGLDGRQKRYVGATDVRGLLTILLCLARPDARNRLPGAAWVETGTSAGSIDMIVVDHIERPSAD
jgi:hypothetical protein